MSLIYRVVKPYRSAYPDPLVFSKGQVVTTSARQTDWPGWVWCTTASGDSRWVPDIFLEQTGKQAVMRRDYNPIELSVQVDELLTACEQVNGWARCINIHHQQGWVPLACLIKA
jgi:Variant SH3 domain